MNLFAKSTIINKQSPDRGIRTQLLYAIIINIMQIKATELVQLKYIVTKAAQTIFATIIYLQLY